MKKFLILLCIGLVYSFAAFPHEKHVLIFSKTEGFRHASITSGIAAIQQLGEEHHFYVDATEDASVFTFDNLIQYDAVIFLSTTGDILNNEQQAAFEQYIQSGGGFVGIHAASDTEYSWPWYGELVGAYFDSHPPGTPTATIKVADKVHPSTNFLPDYWVRTDEWYNYRENPRGKVHVLMTLDESTYSGGNMGYDHPIAWLHAYDGGRAWYTGGGHTSESFSEPQFLAHILGGIQYATREVQGSYEGTVYDKYQVTVIDNNPSNPMNLTVLPNLDVLYVERGGTLKRRNHSNGLIETVATLQVDSGREDGLLGIVTDPDFETNNWLYLFYSPETVSEQRVSRFTYSDGALDMESEEIILRIPVQRTECCHSGGDLEFDGDGNLFITTGDNTNPFQSDGFAPIDERPGFSAFDAQGTSGNTNDLRGKILRIHPEDDGTYTIPEGNLFKNGEDGLPEIFVMGTRNPFRMAVNTTNNELVWGDVGPDSRSNNANRGPIGYDEFNKTTEAGNFGWPYCIANNLAYVDFNFATNTSGTPFNCSDLTNNSPNNTGTTQLPPAKPAWLYYPYGFSELRPELGSADARTAIGGDFFHYNADNDETGSFPAYFDNTLFIAEWTRNWIKEVRLDADGNLLQINPFLETLNLNRPIDLHFGPDGALHVIEWGTGFSGNNADARIIKIEFIENLANRPPTAIADASVTNGTAPLTVQFSASRSFDPDDDPLTYSWDFDGNGSIDATSVSADYTYQNNGAYTALLTVFDTEGDSSTTQVNIAVGNKAPIVNFEYPQNGSIYEEGDMIPYRISVSDEEQGTIGNGIDCGEVSMEPSIGHDDHSHGTGPISGCKGSFLTEPHGDGPDNVFYVLNGSFTDNGGAVQAPITSIATVVLQRKIKQAQHASELIDAQLETTGDELGGGQNVGFINHNSALKFTPYNFENIEFVTLRYASEANSATVEFRVDSIDGKLIGSLNTSPTGAWQEYDYFTTAITNPGGTRDLYVVFKNQNAQTGLGNINWMEFHGKGVARNNADSLVGLAASYYPNSTFSGTPVIRKDPMIAWNWKDAAPLDGIPSDGFSVRWEGEIVPGANTLRTLSIDGHGASIRVWLDGEEVISGFNETTAYSFRANNPVPIVVEYVHTTGEAALSLKWRALGGRENVIHANYLAPNTDILTSSEIIPNEIPTDFSLAQNYPNPFNPNTQIVFNLPRTGFATLKVYNAIGQVTATLAENVLEAGTHSLSFNASGLSSGVYFYTLTFEDKTLTRKMLLLK